MQSELVSSPPQLSRPWAWACTWPGLVSWPPSLTASEPHSSTLGVGSRPGSLLRLALLKKPSWGEAKGEVSGTGAGQTRPVTRSLLSLCSPS